MPSCHAEPSSLPAAASGVGAWGAGALRACLGVWQAPEKNSAVRKHLWVCRQQGVRGEAKSDIIWPWDCPEEAGWQGRGPAPRVAV